MRVLGLRRGRGSVWKREEGEVEGGLGRRRRDWAGRFVRVVMAGSVSRFREREREREREKRRRLLSRTEGNGG